LTDDDRTRREGPLPRRPTTEHTRLEGENAAVVAAYLARGTLVGRYVVLDVLGEGGMGVVYSAFDPELDRKVAIKLLQAREGGSTAGGDHKAWLVREAQALARLSHPNVVAVYDVGALDDDRVFVAMELVDGVTLREWLKVPRPWREVLPVLVAAGAGLAAAHEAGLVHRDFKPDNVLVAKEGARDGRPRVMDFGLARMRRATSHDEEARNSDVALGVPADQSGKMIETKSPLSEQLTVAGAMLGTPAYMAPELYAGGTADARSDQFAFAVTLFEALYRARPYKRADLAPPATAKPPAMPANAGELGVPARILRVVLRGLAWERDQRYPSMTALLGELRQDPDARKRTVLAAVGVAALAIAAVVGVYALRARAVPCKGADKRLAGAWDGPIAAQAEAAFTATNKPFAAPAFAGVKRHLDRYTREWTAAVTESCEATRVRGEQTEDVLTLREACLDNHLDEVRALTGLLVQADAAMVEKGDKLVLDLDPISECANVTALRAPGLPPPELRAKVAELAKQLAAAKADSLAGHYLASLTKAQGVIDAAKPLNYLPTLAEALVVHGAALLTVGNFADASSDFREAVWDAIRGKRDDLAARAGLSMALVTSNAGGKPGEAKIWLGHAQALGSRLGIDRNLELRTLEIESLIEAESGENTAAIATGEKTLALGEAVYGKDAAQLVTDEVNLADAYSHAGVWPKAAPHYERAKALRAASVGAEHPDIALIESDLGACYNHMGEVAKARAAFEQSLAIRERFYGKTSPLLVATLDNFGELLRKQGDLATALAYQERALPLCRMVPGVAHPFYHQLVTDYADTLIAAKRFADAHKWLDEVFVLEDQNHSSTLPASQTTRAELALAEQQWADAESYAALAIAGYETAGGTDNPTLWRPLTALARAKVGQGKPGEAKALLARALAIGAKAQVSADDLAPTKALVASLPAP